MEFDLYQGAFEDESLLCFQNCHLLYFSTEGHGYWWSEVPKFNFQLEKSIYLY